MMAGRRFAATVAGAVGTSLLPWLLSSAPQARSAWCWAADGKDPSGPTGGVVMNTKTLTDPSSPAYTKDPKGPYYRLHMSPCCKSVSDAVPTWYCFDELECDCASDVGKLVCSAKMGADYALDDVLSEVPGRAVACPAAKWQGAATFFGNSTSLFNHSNETDTVFRWHKGAGLLMVAMGFAASAMVAACLFSRRRVDARGPSGYFLMVVEWSLGQFLQVEGAQRNFFLVRRALTCNSTFLAAAAAPTVA
eukprot:CAMPEP_0172711972 /NCGR_PEP_ID=MMETSP1074-20121228/60832_1 /TAXON_ID=2916 /ORGANISM="Ceratium fusus, Strain PA161109" /LENGTH=248 /DNA_ID=CAMNT_0013535833 /DNA_START=59 /DNA_END=803 /DNA_ORIENTATION=+